MGICNVSRIDLWPAHKRGALDPKSFSLITFKKSCEVTAAKCFVRHALALIHFCRVRFGVFPSPRDMAVCVSGSRGSHSSIRLTSASCGECAVSVRSTTAAQPDFTRNPRRGGLSFDHRVLKRHRDRRFAIPGWEQTSIAEAFLSRPGRACGFPVDVTIWMSVTFPCESNVNRKRPVPDWPGRDWPGWK